MGKMKKYGMALVFAGVFGAILGGFTGVAFEDWIVGAIVGLGGFGFSLDVMLNGSACE